MKGSSSVALSNLRACVIVIVIAFHASLAYLASAPRQPVAFDQPPHSWLAFPIVDAHHWLGFDIFCATQDVSLMSLMFLLSGLFAAGSLRRKGSTAYVSDRLRRIGVPFLLALIFLSPLAYYPSYLVHTAEPSLADYGRQWFSLSFWPNGPQWFLWQLLAANIIGAALYASAPACMDRLGKFAAWSSERPFLFLAVVAAASAIAYVPLALVFSPWRWTTLGLFSLQLCRPLHYLVYFFAGVALGSHGIDRGLLAYGGPLARKWPVLLAAAVASFAAWAGFTSLTFPAWDNASIAARIAASCAFPVACAAGSLFMLAVCLRYAAALRIWIVDTLSDNAYTMYLLHYPFVVWLQFALLGSGLFLGAKFALVFTGALSMTWAASLAVHYVLRQRVVATKRAVSTASR